MLKFPGFSDVEKIHEGKRSTIFSATKDAQSVIIKYLNKENPTADDIVHYQYEYELLKDIDDVCFMRVLDFQLYENSCFIVMEDARMKSVEELLKDTQLDMKQKLNLALEMTKLLDRLYDRHIIHKSFTLSNILYDPDNSTVKLTNFASAITLSFEQNIFKNPHAQEGELCYYSPEHTGRMNRNVDYRSDFYSFGVCLYKLFCGVFPFEEENRLKLFHLIIASMAIPPHERLASIPTALSKIIMKLLEKNAEDRYQSVHGLRSDISRLIDKLGTGADVDFDVCQDDHTGVLHIPQKLFGREDEVKTLMGSFKRVSEGAKEILLVSGYSGVGKSVLVNEVHKPITKKQGFFIEGKFDQFQKDKPYLTMVQAFSTWIEHIMNEPKPEQERWKERLLHALGRNAQVIIELIPAFERLLGKQAPAETLSGIEAQNRFNFLFTSLVNCIASKEHPLVLFIDDLQWSDQATLNLIETLFLDAQSSYFLLFGAYRDNEVDETHPFIKSMEQMKKEGVTIGDLRIGNLTKEDVTGLLSETLDQSAERILELVDLIYEKTAGNAFFVNNFIEALYHEGLLCFDFDTQAWIWDIQAIRDKKLTDNVVDLMSKEISKFSGDTQKALTMAACIGNRFDLNTLSIISERTIKDSASDLSEALRRGLIIPLKEAYKYIDYTHDECNVVYKFAHDRIQQAAYSFLSEEGKPSVHLRIGKLLKENTKDEALDDKLFDIVNHMNIGASLILDKALRQEMSVLNYKAALKAQKSVAFQASYDFLTFSLEYMDEHHWEDDYGLSYDAYLMKSEVSYMVQDFATSKVLIEEILCHAKTGVEKAKAQNVSVLRETMQGNYSEAIAFGREGMKNIGFSLPEDAYDENFGKDLHEINSYLQTHTISSLGDLPVCEEESVIVATALLMNMGPPTYMAFKPLYPIVCSRFVLLAINHGNTLYSSIAYSNYGIVLAAMMGQYDTGYEFGLVSLKVGKAFKNMQQVCKNSFMFATILNNWVHPIKMGDAINEEGYQIGIQSGDLQFVGYILFSKLLLSYVQGHALDEIKEKLPFSYRYQEKTHNKWAIDNIGALSFAVNRLKGEMPTLISEEEYLDSVSDDEGQSGLCFYKIFMAQVEFIFKNYEKSLALSEEAASILFNIYGFLPVLDNNYYHSLSCSMLALKKPRDERQEEIRIIEKNQEQLKAWADKVNENFLHKYLFVEAQLAWLKGHNEEARVLYNGAIEAALLNNFIQDVAIINEYFGLFLAENDTQKVAMLYFKDAVYYYERWTADAKVKELKAFILERFNILESDTHQSEQQLDYASIIESIHLISSEVDLSSLIQNYVTISMENAGAQRAVLLAPKGDDYEVLLEMSAGSTKQPVMHKLLSDFSDEDLLIHPLVEKVHNTAQAIIIDDASSERSGYEDTAYVLKHAPLSVLVFPILYNDALEAILYLENALVRNLFTPERVEVLKILSAQVAISFENAHLYANLEDKVEERTKELKETNKSLENTVETLKMTQKQLVESEKIASLGRLVAGVAHEVNTPIGICMTGITSITKLLKNIRQEYDNQTMTKSSYEEFLNDSLEFTHIITKNLRHAAELVRSFKNVAVGQSNEVLGNIALKTSIEEVIVSIGSQLRQENIDVNIECSDTLHIFSYGGSLYQVFTNLVNNVIMHAFEDEVSKQISIIVDEQKDFVVINFCDNGKGIPEENVSKIFDPFFTTKIGQGGTGLGLNIIHNLITQQLKGSISVSSNTHLRQTCFRIILPKSIHNQV